MSNHGYTLEVEIDEHPFDPREDSTFGRMYIHTRRNHVEEEDEMLPDGFWKELRDRGYASMGDFVKAVHKALERKHGCKVLLMQIRSYSHGSVGYRLYEQGDVPSEYPWNCQWDSGWAGVMYVSYRDIRENFGVRAVTSEVLEKAKDLLRGEMDTYEKYVNGECYLFKIEHHGSLETCVGGYWSEEDALAEGEKELAWYIAEAEKELTPSLF